MKYINSFWSMRKAIGALILAGVIVACSDDDPPLPDNVVKFSAATIGISDDEESIDIDIQIGRAISEGGTIVVDVTASNLEYGVEYTTEPALTAGKISLPVQQGATSAKIKLVKLAEVFDGDEEVTFTISSIPTGLVLGTPSSAKASFSEILSEDGILDLNGGGAKFPNKVFVDLSANRQVSIDRLSWDLGFYNGSDYRVIVNSSSNMFARPLTKTSLNDVTAQDTVGFSSAMALGYTANGNFEWIDDATGALSNTAFAEISSTDSENVVYIVKPEQGEWKKVRVLRNADGYKIQYASIGSTTFTENTIAKNSEYNFEYFSFANGDVSVEPVKDRWDIAWSYVMHKTALGESFIAYGYQDMVLTNIHGGAKSIEVLTTETKTYNTFTASDLSSLTLDGTNQIVIGSGWRATGMSGASVKADRFYVIEDASGNVYKLKFNSLTKDGVRGTPQIEYALLKAGS